VVVHDEEPDSSNVVSTNRRAHSGPRHGVHAPQNRDG
jgi:hypothetical protein